MQEIVKAGDLVTLKPFAHRRSWERVGKVQWTRGGFAAVRWVGFDEPVANSDLSRFPVTQRSISELEAFSSENPGSKATTTAPSERW